MQEDLSKLHKWALQWQLGFNQTKCKVLHIGVTNPRHDYRMVGVVLSTTEHEHKRSGRL